MNTRNILASLSYFSIFFAPILIPLVLWIITNDRYVARHAKSALLSHIVPTVFLVLAIVFFMSGVFFIQNVFVGIALFVIFGLLSLILFIWNIIMGIKVLQENASSAW